MLLGISMAGLLISMVVSISTMAAIRTSFLDVSRKLSSKVTSKSADALTEQMSQNIYTLVENKSTLNAASVLQQFLDQAKNTADYVSGLYREPDMYKEQEVHGPRPEDGGAYTLQRYVTSDTNVEEIQSEAELLGNAQYVFDPLIRNHSNVITTVYLATESGFLLSYDPDSNLAENDIYDFKEKEWYQMIKQSQKPMFTDAYMGAYGWGMMTTCGAPFYHEDGSFAGVVCIDILLENIQNEIIDVAISENSKAYLADFSGNIIAGPGVDYSSDKFMKLDELNQDEKFRQMAEDMTAGGSGVMEIEDTFYAYAPINCVRWSLLIEVPEADIVQPVIEMRQTIEQDMENSDDYISASILGAIILLLSVLVISILVILYASVKFTGKLVAPIQSMQKQVRTVSEGNLDITVHVESHDEIGELADNFNRMVCSLKEHIRQIRLVTAEKERIGAELNVATQIQADMLPNIFPPFPDRKEIDIYATMTPAKEVGGDFYDFFMVDDRHLAMVVADVSGKGVPAALFMVIGKTLIKDHTKPGLSLGDVFTEVNKILCESNKEGLFITAFECVLDLVTGELVFVNAGHELPFILDKSGSYHTYKTRAGFVLAGMEGMKYRQGTLQLELGDKLFLYTDGVTEATSKAKELYGMERLEKVLNANRNKNPQELLPAVKADIDAFVGDAPQFDDITMLCMEYRCRMDSQIEEK